MRNKIKMIWMLALCLSMFVSYGYANELILAIETPRYEVYFDYEQATTEQEVVLMMEIEPQIFNPQTGSLNALETEKLLQNSKKEDCIRLKIPCTYHSLKQLFQNTF